MTIKYWQLKLKTSKSVDEINAAVGRSGANIVRIHVEAGETHVYLAGDESLEQHVAEATKGLGNAQEVKANAVTKLS